MKAIVNLAILLVFAAGLQGCATYGRISGVPSEGQKSVFKDGRKALVSTMTNTVTVAPKAETFKSGQRVDFVVAVNNGTAQDITFSTENVAATTNDEKSDQQVALKVFSYEELVREEKKRQAWAAVAAALDGLSDSLNAANAGYSNTYGTYSGSSGYGRYSSSTYDYATAQAAQNAAQVASEARYARVEAEGRENLEYLSSAILKKETVFPGAWHGGIVKVQLPEVSDTPVEIQLVVDVGGEEHRFMFTQEKVESQ